MGSTVVSHFEILEKIGEGGFGTVYKARDRHLPRLVALKFVFPHLLKSPEAVRRFQQEARAISLLSHPNIVVLHDFDTDPDTGHMFLVLEYLSGGTLRELIRQHAADRRSLRPQELLRCGIAIAAGLSHAHRHGIVHRDIKSSNVMFSEERIVKITDFGLAKSDGGLDITATGCAPGTICYMSPEQANGLEVDHRADIFALGIVLYEMAAGQLPFNGASYWDVLRQVVTEPTPRLLQADLPEEIDRIIQRATAKRPSERYPDMEQLETELLAAQHRLEFVAELPTTTLPAPVPFPAPRRSYSIAAVLALLLAAMLFTSHISRERVVLAPARPRLLAVLPFQCLAADESRQAFCEGLAHTLSTTFTQTEPYQQRVVVVPYSEVRREAVASASDAHAMFQAHLAVTGSVEFLGESVRIIVNLVDAEKKVQLRSRKLDSQAGSLMALQDETSELAATMLDLRLRPAERERVHAGQTRHEAAYASFVRGFGYLGSADIADVRRAAALLEEAVRTDPSFALAHARLGEAYLRQYHSTEDGRWIARAQASCEHAFQIDRRVAQAHITMGQIWLARTQPRNAIAELQAALDAEPRNAEALRTLGNAYAQLGKRDPAWNQQAIETLREAISLRPELWTTYRDLGLAYYRMGDYPKAERQFRLMIDFTRSADAYCRLGALYHVMDRPEEATAWLQKSLAVKPTPEAYANLGTVAYYLQRYAEVIPNFENALRLSEETRTRKHVIWGNLAMAYSRTPGMEAKARHAFRQAIRIAEDKLRTSPQDAETHANLAYYLVRAGDKNKARRHAGEAMRLSPQVAAVLFRCSLVYERLNARGQAVDYLARAIEQGHPVKEVLHAEDLAALRRDPRIQEKLNQ